MYLNISQRESMLGKTQKFNNLILVYGRKIHQEILDSVSAFQIVEKVLYRHARARKYGLTALYLGRD